MRSSLFFVDFISPGSVVRHRHLHFKYVIIVTKWKWDQAIPLRCHLILAYALVAVIPTQSVGMRHFSVRKAEASAGLIQLVMKSLKQITCLLINDAI